MSLKNIIQMLNLLLPSSQSLRSSLNSPELYLVSFGSRGSEVSGMQGAETGRGLVGAFSFAFWKLVLTRGQPGCGPVLAWAEPSPTEGGRSEGGSWPRRKRLSEGR